MSHRLTVQPKAENDALRAYHWYEAELSGLGLQFLDALDTDLSASLPIHFTMLSSLEEFAESCSKSFLSVCSIFLKMER